MTEYSVDRKTTKTLFLRLIFSTSNGFTGWAREHKIEHAQPTKLIRTLMKDIAKFTAVIQEHNPELYNFVLEKKQRQGKTNNVTGSFLSYYLQEWEYRILECCFEHLVKNTTVMDFPGSTLNVGTYEFDGLKLLEANVAQYYDDIKQLLEDLNRVSFEGTGSFCYYYY